MSDERSPAEDEEPRIFKPGDPFRGRQYVVESFLGAGASGQVYAVRHLFTGDRFALKVGHLKDRRDAKKVARSLIEALAGYRIRHQNVVRVLDLACEDDGMVWQLMELLEGKSIGELLQRYGRFSPLYAIDVATEVAWGLSAAHDQQVIHRDVQPSNIFVTTSGVVKVLDFSLAKVIPSGLQTTQRKRSFGTAPYMAPEQMKGAPANPQFDVHALGFVLWQMLVGRHPFEETLRDFKALILRMMNEIPPSLSVVGLPSYCDDVIRAATNKRPEDRFAGMWPFARALMDLRERLLADRSVAHLVRSPPTWERQHPIARDPSGARAYLGPKSLPENPSAPRVPSARVVVPEGSTGSQEKSGASGRPAASPLPWRGTIALDSGAPPGPTLKSPLDGWQTTRRPILPATVLDATTPPTRRAPSRKSYWLVGIAIVAVPVLVGLGVGLAFLIGGPAPDPASGLPTTQLSFVPGRPTSATAMKQDPPPAPSTTPRP